MEITIWFPYRNSIWLAPLFLIRPVIWIIAGKIAFVCFNYAYLPPAALTVFFIFEAVATTLEAVVYIAVKFAARSFFRHLRLRITFVQGPWDIDCNKIAH